MNQEDSNMQQLKEGLGLRTGLSNLSGFTQIKNSHQKIVVPVDVLLGNSSNEGRNLDNSKANVMSDIEELTHQREAMDSQPEADSHVFDLEQRKS